VGELGRLVKPIAERERQAKDQRRKLAGYVIGRFLDGERLTAGAATFEQIDAGICAGMRALGFSLPPSIGWREVLDFAAPALLATDPTWTGSIERCARAERAFTDGREAGERWDAKRKAQRRAEYERAVDTMDALIRGAK
jgi:hypothetical protein